jgi:8-oxo-dGTP pyrophosphatase MutT (NUDIX family)
MDAMRMAEGIRARLSTEERVIREVAGYQRAAVLLLLCPSPEGPVVLLTVRTEEVETHKGQISFPGGIVDPGDRDAVHTALREAEEEIGVREEDLVVAGLLDDHVTPTGFVITPVVAVCRRSPGLLPNPREVAEVLRVPLQFFADPGTVRTEERTVAGERRPVHYYDYGRHIIWGATAAIIREFLRRAAMDQDASASFSGPSSPTA